MMLPLIRLKVSYWGRNTTSADHKVETTDAKEMTNPVRFGQDFIGRVANPRDILQYYRKKKQAERSKLPPTQSPEADI
jgi:double-strand break repair protein MRE11